MQRVKLGVIGIGNMGSAHCENIVNGLCPEVELTAVADIDPARLAWAENHLPQTVTRFDSAEALIESGCCEAVIIAVPHYLHPPVAIAAFRHDLHVLTEKPAGVYTKQVREMIAEADRHDVKFGIMWNQRTNHLFRKIKELVSSGEYGELRRVNWLITNWYRSQAYYNSGSWRATWSGEGGGVLMNQCPHQLDLLQWICGMPVEIDARMQYGRWHHIEVEDDVSAFLKFKNGATGVFVTGTGDAWGTNRLEILLDRARLVAEQERLTVTVFDRPIDEFTYDGGAVGEVGKTEFTAQTDGKDEEHIGVVNAFAAAILRGTPLIADGREGLQELTLSNAMYLSAWLGQTVTLPLDEDLYWEELQKRIASSKPKEVNKSAAPSGGNARERWRVKW